MGYLLFERKESDEIGATLAEAQAAVKDYGKFSLILKLKAQFFFRSAEEALANCNDVSEGIVTPRPRRLALDAVSIVSGGKQGTFQFGANLDSRMFSRPSLIA